MSECHVYAHNFLTVESKFISLLGLIKDDGKKSGKKEKLGMNKKNDSFFYFSLKNPKIGFVPIMGKFSI